MMRSSGSSSLGRPAQVVGRQQPDRHVLDAGLGAPVQQVGDVPRADDVALADVLEAGGARPPPVAVDHDRDVAAGPAGRSRCARSRRSYTRVDGVRRPTSPTIAPRAPPSRTDARAAAWHRTYGCRNLGRDVDRPHPPRSSTAVAELKPRLRGWLHAYAAPISIAQRRRAGRGRPPRCAAGAAGTATAIYAGTVTLLFGTSALYHRLTWGPRAHGRDEAPGPLDDLRVHRRHVHADRRADPAPRRPAIAVLVVVWTGALFGVGLQTAWPTAPRWLVGAVLHRARLGGGVRAARSCCTTPASPRWC